jgi:UDP:flavonoid glycosyltransferase YjiC (YdhE family)
LGVAYRDRAREWTALRILFTFAGGTGHFLPMAPVARAAEAAGHVIAFAGQPRMVPMVEAAGFAAFDTGGDTLLATRERQPLVELDAEREARVVREVFAGSIARERAGAILAVCQDWRPDILVCDEMDFGGVVVAERLGIPHVTVLCLGSRSLVPTALITEPLNELRAEHRLPLDPDLEMRHRYLVLSPFPPSYLDPAFPLPRTAHTLRLVSSELPGDESAPPWLANLPDKPTIYVTLGTIFSLESGDLFERVLAGVRDLDVSVVVTVGRELDPHDLGLQPPNVHVEGYIPQSLLLPHCSLVVSHAGAGSVVGALAHGLPMVLIPLGADQPLNAARCEDIHVAQVLDALETTPGDVRDAVSAVLEDAMYRLNAERIRDEIAALPGPEHAVALLEHLAVERRPSPST